MAFNTGGAAGGALTGAQMGSAFGPIGTGIGALAGGALGGFMGGGDDMELQDMRSAEQKLAEIYQGARQSQAYGAAGLTGLADQVAQISGLNMSAGDMQRQMQHNLSLGH